MSKSHFPPIFCITLAVSCFFGGCGDATHAHDHDHGGQATDAQCNANALVTYANFTDDFMAQYCTECHASALQGAQRQGAPSDHNFDTLDAIRDTESSHIDLTTAAGPNGVNTLMPPADYRHQPTDEERRKLGEWLACGMQ